MWQKHPTPWRHTYIMPPLMPPRRGPKRETSAGLRELLICSARESVPDALCSIDELAAAGISSVTPTQHESRHNRACHEAVFDVFQLDTRTETGELQVAA